MTPKITFQIAAALLLCSAATSLTWAQDHDAHKHMGMDPMASIGKAGDASKVSRTISVEMRDNMRFTPEAITVRRGETVRFLVKNAGQIPHEFNLGTAADFKAHAVQMQKAPQMAHGGANVADVAPGKTAELVWQFAEAGSVDIACLYPGHYAAGMKGTIQVVSK